MELLIPGLALVALMVWASTRIKRSAAKAFEAEYIEGEGFSLNKPDGFLQKLDDKSKYAFEAYSKEFGSGNAGNMRAATAVVIVNDENGEASDHVIHDGYEYQVRTKTISSSTDRLTLRVEVLAKQFDDFARKIDEMLTSFAPR